MPKIYISFGGQVLIIKYPHQAAAIIDFTFHDFPKQDTSDAGATIEVVYNTDKKLFTVSDKGKGIGENLDQTDLAQLLLTRSTQLLVHDISSGPAIHGAAVQRNGKSVLIPAGMGSGKSILTSWLLAQGYSYLTDELVCFPEDGPLFTALTRPVCIKQAGKPLIDPIIESFCPPQSRQDLILQNKTGTLFSHRIFNDELIPDSCRLSFLLFIQHIDNAVLSLDPISPAQAAQRLMGCLVNGRNLKLHGLPHVASFTRHTPALVLQYSDCDQLENILTPIIDFVLEAGCTPQAFQSIIKAFKNLTSQNVAACTKEQQSRPTFPIQEATPPGKKRKITFGMATYDDYDGVYFSVQALRMYHPEIIEQCEFLVIDNHPDGPCAGSLKKLESIDGYRYVPLPDVQGTAVRDAIFQHATGDYVVCMDCHVFVVPGALHKLINFFEANPNCNDLLQGPMIHDDLKTVSTHFEPVWQGGMYGIWGHDEQADNVEGAGFDIVMQGLGFFACRKKSWPGFNPRFYGFGGEEGYIHEKFRQAGGRTLCLPFLRWLHRFERPLGVPYPIQWKDRIHNYLVGFAELGLDTRPVKAHFIEVLGKESATEIFKEVTAETTSPFYFFDAVYCITLDTESERWKTMKKRFQALGISRRVRIFKAIKTPDNHHIGCALSHRAVIVLAKQQKLYNVLVFEDDALFLDTTLRHLEKSVAELKNQKIWNLFYLGGHRWNGQFVNAAGCSYLQTPYGLTCTHALAYNNTVYDRIVRDLPDTVEKMGLWIQDNHGIGRYLSLLDGLLLASPVVATGVETITREKTE